MLVDAGIEIDSHVAPCGKTPLHYAAEHGHYAIVDALVAAGASKAETDSDGRRPWEVVREGAKYSRLADLLKDPPSRVAAVGLSRALPNALVINFANTVAGYHQSKIDTYTVESHQVTEHLVNPDYTRARSLLIPEGADHAMSAFGRRLTEGLEDEVEPRIRLERGVPWRAEGLVIDRLHPDTSYDIRVSAHNVAGDGQWSAVVQMRTSTTVPGTPGMPTVARATVTSLTLAWLPVPYENGKELVGYEFQRLICSPWATLEEGNEDVIQDEKGGLWVGKNEDCTRPFDWNSVPFKMWTRYRLKPQEEPNFTVAGLEPNAHVVFRIRAINEDGWSPFGDIGGPYRAEDFIEAKDVGSRTVDLEWRRCSCVVSRRWELQLRLHTGPAKDSQYSSIADDIVDAAVMRYLVPDLRPGSTYMFRVRSEDRYGTQQGREGPCACSLKHDRLTFIPLPLLQAGVSGKQGWSPCPSGRLPQSQTLLHAQQTM